MGVIDDPHINAALAAQHLGQWKTSPRLVNCRIHLRATAGSTRQVPWGPHHAITKVTREADTNSWNRSRRNTFHYPRHQSIWRAGIGRCAAAKRANHLARVGHVGHFDGGRANVNSEDVAAGGLAHAPMVASDTNDGGASPARVAPQ